MTCRLERFVTVGEAQHRRREREKEKQARRCQVIEQRAFLFPILDIGQDRDDDNRN